MQMLSLVFPVYNEEESLQILFDEVTQFFATLDPDMECEVVLVDDGSADSSWKIMKAQHELDDRFRPLRLSRNFGHQTALTAGLDAAEGDAVLVMDADLQDPLNVARKMVDEWQNGSDIVYGRRVTRDGETWLKKLTAFAFYRVMKTISRDPTPRDVGDFYLLSRPALDDLKRMREPNRYLRGMVFWLGYEPKEIPYERQSRTAGTTKFNYRRMISFALDGILSSSSFPLIIASYGGVLMACLGALLAARNVFVYFTQPDIVPGWTHSVVITLILGGIQLATIGVLGLYIGRIYDQVKNRPLYLVREKCSGSADSASAGDTD